MAKFRHDLLQELSQQGSTEEATTTTSPEENDKGVEDDEDDETLGEPQKLHRREEGGEDDLFADSFPDVVRRDRLDTVEEVSEPLSSSLQDSLPVDSAARFGGSSGNASSDFQQWDSLPNDQATATTQQNKGAVI